MRDSSTSLQKPRLTIPRNWSASIQAAMLQVIALAQYSLAYSRSWATNSLNERLRLTAKTDQLQQEVALLREEIRIKDLTPSEADRDNSSTDFSIQMERRAQVLTFQHSSEPTDLVRRLEERVIAVNGRVLSLDDILDFADRFAGDITDALDMLRNE
jgi:hypothetical protein